MCLACLDQMHVFKVTEKMFGICGLVQVPRRSREKLTEFQCPNLPEIEHIKSPCSESGENVFLGLDVQHC